MIDLSNESMIHVKKDNIEYLQFRRLLQYSNIIHAYTLSVNNFDIAGNDDMEEKQNNVIYNYKRISKALEFDYNHIIRPYQTHTNVVECVEKQVESIDIFESYKNVDGLITDKPDIVFSLGFADCTPLYLYDTVKNVIADIHSGWKGTTLRIGQKAVERMIEKYSCNPKDIICCIGPAISKCHFEVDEDVYELFFNEFSNMAGFEKAVEKREKYNIDTNLINKMMMIEVGLKEENVIESGICTVCSSHYMHSYRMDGKKAGRNTGVMGLRREEYDVK